jgi:dephospho-CoA kinase
MKVIGLTGGIGSGKSTVARLLAEQGAVIVDLDRVGHEVLKKGSQAYGQVVGEFGEDILKAPSGEIDRSKLGRIVFNSHEALTRLNRIVHPAIDNIINSEITKYRRQGVKVVVLEAAAMLEADKTAQVDELWVTIAPEATVLRRILERGGLSEQEIRARIKAQLSNEERIRQADVVINTDCTLDELKARVTGEWEELLQRV